MNALIQILSLLLLTIRHIAARLEASHLPFFLGTRTNSNCPLGSGSTSCFCADGATRCSYDQDCPSSKTYELHADCPKGGAADCNQRTLVEVIKPPAEGSCQLSLAAKAGGVCSGVQETTGLIAGDINQCNSGSLCGDFGMSFDGESMLQDPTNPVNCIPCLKPMTCHDWCNLDDNLGSWKVRGSLESHGASTTCPGGGYDSCTCTLYSMWANGRSIAKNTHAGAICGAHHFGPCGDKEGWCTDEFPKDSYCASLGAISITGTLNADSGVCTCHATVGPWKKDVWSSECIENLYDWSLGPDGNGGEKSMGLPCSFTG